LRMNGSISFKATAKLLTFIGRIERGFDFLGYHFTADRLTLAVGTLANVVDRATRLYEKERQRPKGPSPLGAYVKRWCAWARNGRSVHRPR
jgi:RNA-directed DNA polymerase